MTQKNDIMVDLETMSNHSNASIVSIGMIQCNLITGELGEEFYRVVDLTGQQARGLHIDESTMYWWMNQSDSARRALLQDNKITIEEMCVAVLKFIEYLQVDPKSLRLWGNGASFDNAILRTAFLKCGFELPIPFWNDRDMRTIVGFYPRSLGEKWKRENMRKGTLHNALEDAKHQVRYCSHILQELGVEELY